MTLIILTGKAGAGKSTAANYLAQHHGYEIVKFAAPLKNMLRAIGLTDSEIEGHNKERPCDLLCGNTPRHAMQTLGTEWGRDCIGEDFWVGVWRAKVKRLLGAGVNVVTDDCRFANELAAATELGGVRVHIEVDSTTVSHSTFDGHSSEKGLPLEDNTNLVVNSLSGFTEFYADLRAAVPRHDRQAP